MPVDRYIDGSRILPKTIPLDRIAGLFVTPQTGATRPTRPGEEPGTTMPRLVLNVALLADEAIEGIKLAVGSVDLESAVVVGDLSADRISTGSLSADIAYLGTIATNQLVAGAALIGNALIGDLSVEKLTGGHIQAAVEMSSPVLRWVKTTIDSTSTGFYLGKFVVSGTTHVGINIGSSTKYLKYKSNTGVLEIVGGLVTGGIVRTAASGARAELSSESGQWGNAFLSLYTGNSREFRSGAVASWASDNPSDASVQLSTVVASPQAGSDARFTANITLTSEAANGSTMPHAQIALRNASFSFRETTGHGVLRVDAGSHGAVLKFLSSSATIQARNIADNAYGVLHSQTLILQESAAPGGNAQLTIGGFPFRLSVDQGSNTVQLLVYSEGAWRVIASNTY